MNEHQKHHARIFAVDIGNSGMKVVDITSNHQQLPNPLLIRWATPFAGNEAGNSPDIKNGRKVECSSFAGQGSIDEPTFAPGETGWTEQLSKLIDRQRPTQWWISSVNRPATNVLSTFLSGFDNCTSQLIDYQMLPMELSVDFPERVGVDRLLAAFAASCLHGDKRLVVIQAGTAVTVDVVERLEAVGHIASVRFCGGAILPGVPMMLRLLGRVADLLPEFDADDFVQLHDLPGKNTEAAMKLGCSSCLVGGVQHLIERYRHLYGSELSVVVSGGDGPRLAPHLKAPITEIPHLVIQGIRLLASRPTS